MGARRIIGILGGLFLLAVGAIVMLDSKVGICVDGDFEGYCTEYTDPATVFVGAFIGLVGVALMIFAGKRHNSARRTQPLL